MSAQTWIPLSARTNRRTRLVWHIKSARQRTALRLAPWLDTTPRMTVKYEGATLTKRERDALRAKWEHQ